MTQGDVNKGHFFIVQAGTFELQGNGRRGRLREFMGEWTKQVGVSFSFGEVELFYAVPALATAVALEASRCWVIGPADFTRIVKASIDARLDRYVRALQRVKILGGLYKEELHAVAESSFEAVYADGEDIMTQGDEDATDCFVLVEGEVLLLRDEKEIEEDPRRRASSEPPAKSSAHLFGEEELLRP